MKAVLLSDNSKVEIIKSTDKSIASVCMFLCNPTDGDASVNLYVCPAGTEPPEYDENGNLVSGNEETWLARELAIQPKDTITFNLEKILLHNGDRLIAELVEGIKVSVIVSYEEY
jgi:hypothetical protein